MKYTLFLLISLFFIHSNITAQEGLDSLEVAWDVLIGGIVITGQYTATDSRNVLYDIKIIKQEDIELRGASNLEELLVQETGIRISQDLILGSGMSLQGLSGENIKIMIDGVPIIGRLGGKIDLSQISMNNVERIEIIEGPMAVNYGTDALAGVINIISKKSQKDQYEVTLTSAYETVGTQDYNIDFGLRTKNNITFRLNGSLFLFNGIPDSLNSSGNESRDLLWNPKKNWNANALIAYRINDKHKLSLAFNYFDEIIKNDGVLRRPQYLPYGFDDTYKTKRLNPYLTYDASFNKKLHLQSLVSYNRYSRKKNSYRTEFKADTIYNPDGSYHLNFEENSTSLLQPITIGEFTIDEQDTTKFNEVIFRTILAYEFQEIPMSIQAGTDFTYDNAIGKRISDEQTSKDNFSQLGDYGLFGKIRYDVLFNFGIELGIRYAYNTKYKAPIIPSIHLKYDISKYWVIKASYGKGFRAPSLKELYFNFIDSNHYIIGSTNLDAEKSDNIQGSISYDFKKKNHNLAIKSKVFYNYVKDKISLYEFEPDPSNPSPELEYTYFNQSIYKTIGNQINLKYNFKNYHFTSSFASTGYFNPLSQSYSGIKTYSHSFETVIGFTYSHPKYHFNIGTFFKYNDRLISYYPDINEDGDDIGSQNIIGGYSIIDFNASKSLFKDRLGLSFGIQNLLNTTTVNRTTGISSGHGNSGSTSIVSMGRNFIFRIKLKLGK